MALQWGAEWQGSSAGSQGKKHCSKLFLWVWVLTQKKNQNSRVFFFGGGGGGGGGGGCQVFNSRSLA